jgi:hypothetical protein
MKYMRRTAGYTWVDYKPNAQIARNTTSELADRNHGRTLKRLLDA